jgi:hypothetical protein
MNLHTRKEKEGIDTVTCTNIYTYKVKRAKTTMFYNRTSHYKIFTPSVDYGCDKLTLSGYWNKSVNLRFCSMALWQISEKNP